MTEKSKKIISDGIVLGKKVLSFSERVIIELIEQVEDMEYMRTHCYAVIGRNVRSMRYESKEGTRLHEEKERRLYEERMKRQAIERLRKQRFIKARKEGDRIVYELTTSGKVRALKTVIRLSDDYYLDNRFCLVSFDFPVAANEARRYFRRFIKSIGFKFVQGSVWMIKKNVSRELKALVVILNIKRWVEIYEAH